MSGSAAAGACAFANETDLHPVKGLKIKLLGVFFYRHKPHRWPLHGLRNRLCIPEIALIALQKRLHKFGRHQPGTMAKRD
jgi:hypothetical protein